MCGIGGIAGDISHLGKGVFRDLMDVVQLRGRDSTGVIKVAKNLTYNYMKDIGSPSYLFDTLRYVKKIETGPAMAYVGHCRSKTVGDVSEANAHPFDYPEEGIIGIHNGTLRNHYKLHGHHHSKVDSDVLYGHLAKHGPVDTFSELEGAFACVWWDNNNKTLNFIRNDERPLYFTWSKDLKMMFWVSEPWMFNAIARKIPLWEGTDATSAIYELPPMQLWSFELRPDAKNNESPIVRRPVVNIVKKAPVFRNNRTPFAFESDAWTEMPDGTLLRKNGGSVTSPFEQERARMKARASWGTLLDDPVTDLGGPSEKETTPLLSLPSSRPSTDQTVATPVSTGGSGSKRNILSLPSKTSSSSTPTPSAGSSNGPTASSGKSVAKISLPKGVSLRVVAGMDYITDNTTQIEYSKVDFFTQTGGECVFCKSKIDSLKEVGSFIDKNKVLCTDCLSPPAKSAIN